MNEKITWYKEVLELEPGSRIFFPLAKLLAAEGQDEDAIATLRQGLARHPDHVEARLMLVELLSREQSPGAAKREVDDLSALFSAYPGFWQAWSEHLAKTPATQDASVAMRFFSESINGRKLDWSAVIEAGLKALLFNEGGVSANSGDSGQTATRAALAPDSAGVAKDATGSVKSEDARAEDAPPVRVTAKLSKPTAKKVQPPASAKAAALPVSTEDEEGVSLRTRTMADVLADQGDFASAAEIYQELADKAEGAIRQELLSRYEDLKTRAVEAPAPAAPEDDTEDFEDSGSETSESSRLVDLLESLALRLEERGR